MLYFIIYDRYNWRGKIPRLHGSNRHTHGVLALIPRRVLIGSQLGTDQSLQRPDQLAVARISELGENSQ